MDSNTIKNNILAKKSFLCIGLDTDLTKIPSHLLADEDPMFAFNKAIIDATKDLCVSYKINTAFYEAQGLKGWQSMIKTLAYIPKDIFTIADAKRGDIGNTSTQYAKAFFETMDFDSITVAPYMGADSVQPFLAFVGNNLMFVIGATKAAQLKDIRTMIPNHFLLIPGVGTQGGSLQEVCINGMNDRIGLLVNVSRQIIYAGNESDFAQKAREAASQIQQEMSTDLS